MKSLSKTFSLLLILFYVFACKKDDKAKEDFIGKWNDFTDSPTYNEFVFSKDSLKYYSQMFVTRSEGTWKVKDNKIIINYYDKYGHFKDLKLNIKDTLHYKFNDGKDSLYISNTKYENKAKHLFLKVIDEWKHYNKIIGLNIELPTTDKKLYKRDSIDNYANLYLSMKNNKLEYSFHDNKHYSNQAKKFVFFIQVDNQNFRIKRGGNSINLIADKNVPEEKIDSLKKEILKFTDNDFRFFKVYKTDKEQYGLIDFKMGNMEKKWSWWGRFED